MPLKSSNLNQLCVAHLNPLAKVVQRILFVDCLAVKDQHLRVHRTVINEKRRYV